MANKLMDEVRKLSTSELLEQNEARKAELFALKFQAAVGSLEKTHRIQEIKKEIARLQLAISEKAKAGENINTKVTTDYNKAVEAAEKSGKEVRAKQRKMLEDMQAQYEQQTNTNDETAIANAIAESSVEDINNTQVNNDQEQPDTEGEAK